MDDDKLLKEIKDSAEHVEIPQSLKPEEVRKRLEEANRQGKERKGKKIISFNKYTRWAAAAAVLLIVFLAAGPVLKTHKASETNSGSAAAQDGVKTFTQDNGKADTEEESTVLHVKDYGELYSMVAVPPVQSNEMPEDAIMDYSTAVASDMDGAVESAQEFDGGSYTTPPYNPAESNQSAAADSAMAAKFMTGSTGVAANSSSEDYSSTNIQEENVDEADIVKTDGKYIYILDTEGTVRIIDAETMDLTGKISSDDSSGFEVADMYVDGDILQIVRSGFDYVMSREELYFLEDGTDETEIGEMDTAETGIDETGTGRADTVVRGEREVQIFRPDRGGTPPVRSYYSVPKYFTEVITYDISDRSAPEEKGNYHQDGRYLTSRKNGEYLYIFTSFAPESGHGVRAKGYYVPQVGDIYLPCESIYLPGAVREEYYGGRNYLVASSLKNSDAGRPADYLAVVNGAGTFYVSGENIYTAVSGYGDEGDYTELVRLGYKDGIFKTGSTGRIPGTLNNNFSLDEYKGKLRAVTTHDEEVSAFWTGQTKMVRSNGLYVLDSNLKVVGKIEDLAQGESIESARFMGDTGYFVTYRNTDPLFSVDLSEPANPRILGELKITGFSEYLHFYGEDKLLGLGWETDPTYGDRIGFKCSMFDLSNPADVRETDRLVLDEVSFCDALDNYKAILAEPEKNIFGFAYAVTNEENWEDIYYYGIFAYDEVAGFRPLRYIKLPDSIANGYSDMTRVRGLYIGDTFYLAGGHGIIAYDMNDDFSKKESFVWND